MPHRTRSSWAVLLTAVVAVASASAVSAAQQPSPASPIDGSWKSSFTLGHLQALGASQSCAQKAYGPWTAEFSHARYRIHNERSGATGSGTFAMIAGNIVRLVTATAVCDKTTNVCKVTVFHNRLALTNDSGYPPCGGWSVATWVRVSS
jgi:hypothetical protein